MVLEMGFEPTRHKPLVPETSVSTIPPLEQHKYSTIILPQVNHLLPYYDEPEMQTLLITCYSL